MWQASLTPLRSLPERLTPSQDERAELFAIIANHHLAQRNTVEQREVVDRLITLAEDATDSLVKARSCSTAAFFLEQMQAQEQPRRLWDAISALDSLTDPPEAVAYVFRAKATLRYLNRDILLSRADTYSAIQIHEANRIFSSAYVDLIVAVSALYCALGEYEAALEPAEKAYRLAKRLDHEHLANRAATNVALVAGRRGQYDEQVKWGNIAIGHMQSHPHPYALLLTSLSVGFGKAMKYEADTMEAVSNITCRIQFKDQLWLRQATSLMEADLLQMLGKKRLALKAARSGTSGKNATLHSLGWAGRFARWVAFTGIESDDRTSAAMRIDALVREIQRYDALDRIEIACSYLLVHGSRGPHSKEMREIAVTLLASMPRAVSDQMERLGMLGVLNVQAGLNLDRPNLHPNHRCS